MTLLEELTGKFYHYRPNLAGRKRVSFALDGELQQERQLVEEAAREAASAAAEAGKASAQFLILAALKDGRARFEGHICELTCLSQMTVTNNLHRLKLKGDVEQVAVGSFRLWSKTA